MKIDLRSDTVTRPTQEMLDYMMSAEVGDDVFNEDPTVKGLQEKAAEMLGMETALFVPSGTMANQIAIKVHTDPMDQVICDKRSHIYLYEGGGMAFNSGVSAKLIHTEKGILKPDDILSAINPVDVHFPKTKLVGLENTCNKAGGTYYTQEELMAVYECCADNNLRLHLDGARLFNALEVSGVKPTDIGKWADSVSICLSKGLGAPVGSLIVGTEEFIAEAKRVRKIYGGGMRQAGYLAAAGIYALDNHIVRLKDDHHRARKLADAISELDYVDTVYPCDTNIVVFNLPDSINSKVFLYKLMEEDILAVPFGPQSIRMVTHLDINDTMIDTVIEKMENLQLFGQ